MPFKSQAQRGFLFANHPAIAKVFAAHTSSGQMQSLPQTVGGHIAQGPKLTQPLNAELSSKTAYAAPKWATNPWGEMIHRKGVKNLRNPGF